MSSEQIGILAELLLVIYMVIVTFGAFGYGYIRGCSDTRRRKRMADRRAARCHVEHNFRKVRALPAQTIERSGNEFRVW